MARTIQEIQSTILVDLRERAELAALDSTSATALYVLITYVVAMAIALLESNNDAYRVELREILATQAPHTLRYYQLKALNYRLGVDLEDGTTNYPSADAETIIEQNVVLYASVREAGETLQVKVAKKSIEPLTALELAAFEDYMNEIKDAGVRLEVSSEPADRLKATIDIYYNPQVIGSDGRRLDGTDDLVVYNAVVSYTENLRFDGQFVAASLVDQLQRTEGIQIPQLRSVSIAPNGDPQFVQAGAIYYPASGFVRVYSSEDLTLNYIPYADA
jgi:hypothetical protein